MSRSLTLAAWGPTLGWIVAWAWTLAAGGGGLWLLMTKGPWPLTNGWFALGSGIAACPLTAWLLQRYGRVTLPGWSRFATALLIFVAGHVAKALTI